MKEGDLVLVAMPQVDGKIKNQPAIILREIPPFGDMLVCGVSTQLHHATELDELISPEDDDFALSGLREESLILPGKHRASLQDAFPWSFCTLSAALKRRALPGCPSRAGLSTVVDSSTAAKDGRSICG